MISTMYKKGLWLWSYYSLSIFLLALACFGHPLSIICFFYNLCFALYHRKLIRDFVATSVITSKICFFYNLCFALYQRVLIRDFVTTSVITPLKKYLNNVKQLISKLKLFISTNNETKKSNQKTEKSNKKTGKSNKTKNKSLSNFSYMRKKSDPEYYNIPVKPELEIILEAFKALKSITKKLKAAKELVTKLPKRFITEEKIRQSCRLMLIELLVCYRKTRLRPLLRFIASNQGGKHESVCGEALIAISVLISKSLDIDIIGHLFEESPSVAIMRCLLISSDDSIFDYILQRMEPFNEKEKEFIRNSGYKQTEYLDRDCKRAELSFIEKFMRKNIIMHGQPLIIDSTQFNFSKKLRLKYKGVNQKFPLLFSNKPPTEDPERELPKAFRVTEKSQPKPRVQKRLLCNFANLDDPREVMEEMMKEPIRAIEEAKQATIEAEKVIEEAKKECKEIAERMSQATAIFVKKADIKVYPFSTRIDKELETLQHLMDIHDSHLEVFDKTKTLLNHSKSIKELNSIYYEVFMTPRRFSDPLKLERGLLELRNLYDILIGNFDTFQYHVGQYDKDIAIIAIQEIEAILPSHPSFSLTNENYISSS